MRRAGWAEALVALALSPGLAGCLNDIGTAFCDRSIEGNPPVLYTEGTASEGIYRSSEPDGELLYFPGGMHYALEHKLGERPDYYHFYLSFSRYGTSDDTLAASAGNQAEIVHVDETRIVVRNGSCADYWLLAVAGLGSPGGVGGVGGVGGAGGAGGASGGDESGGSPP